jgi:hypothetical protein
MPVDLCRMNDIPIQTSFLRHIFEVPYSMRDATYYFSTETRVETEVSTPLGRAPHILSRLLKEQKQGVCFLQRQWDTMTKDAEQ